MWHKLKLEIMFQPKGFMESEKAFHAALREFFMTKGYMMESCQCKDEDEAVFTIEPLPEMIEKKPGKPEEKGKKIVQLPIKTK